MMEFNENDLFLQMIAEHAVKESISKMKDLESKLCQQCRICGDRASGRHYGVPSCDGCRGFFKRSIRGNSSYRCKYAAKCIVDAKRRNQCQYCRFQRCLQVGMKAHSVQNERNVRHGNINEEFRLDSVDTTVSSPQKQQQFIFPTFPTNTRNFFQSIPILSSFPVPLPFSLHCPRIIGSGISPINPHTLSTLQMSPPEEAPSSTLSTKKESNTTSNCKTPTSNFTKTFLNHSIEAITTNTLTTSFCEDTRKYSHNMNNLDSNNDIDVSPKAPVTKNSARYSIDAILNYKENHPNDGTQTPSAAFLTPPTSPLFFSQGVNVKSIMEDTLLNVLEKTIHCIHSVPAFHSVSNEIKSQLLEISWMPILFLGTIEFAFPLEHFILNLNNAANSAINSNELPSIHNISITMERLRQCCVDKTELNFLKLIVLFNPRYFELNEIAGLQISQLHTQTLSLLLEYHQQHYPGAVTRTAVLVNIMNSLQQVPGTLGKFFFSKISNIKNFIHHVHTSIIHESLKFDV